MTDTTQTPAQADATPVVPVDTSVAPEAQKTVTAAPAETETKDTGEPEAAPETPEDKPDAKKSSASERIKQLTAEKHTERRRAESAERSVADLQKQLGKLRQEASKIDPDDEASRQALNTRFAVKAERLEQARAEAEGAAQQASETRQAEFNAKLDAARERIPDLDQALANFATVPVSDVAADLIADSEKAAEIAHYLGRNPAEAHRIHKLPPHVQGAEIARIEAKLSPPVRKASAAPPPVRTNIGGGASPTTKSLSQMSTEEYFAHRRAEMSKGS